MIKIRKTLMVAVALILTLLLVAQPTYAATQTSEVAFEYGNLPLEIHAGDKLIMDGDAVGGSHGSILYIEQFINAEYDTSKWGFGSTDDYFTVYYNDTNFQFSTGSTHTLPADYSDDWISWTVSNNIGTLEFLQDFPYAIDSLFSYNSGTYTAKTALAYTDNISYYAHLEINTELPDYVLASDLGLEISVYGSSINVDDYFKFVERNGYYQLVSNVEDDLSYEKIYEDDYYTNIFSVLNNGTYSINISFGDGQELFNYKLKEISYGGTGVNPSVVQYDGSSVAPSIAINDLGENVRQYNVYDDGILDATYSSGYNQVAKFIALMIEIPDEDEQIATVNFYVEGSISLSSYVPFDELSNGGSTGTTISAPSEPTLAGYIFVGWYDSNDILWDFSANPITTTEVNLYAKFVADTTTIHSVLFEEGLGSALDDRVVVDGETLDQPSNPFLLGHELINWYIDAALTEVYDFSEPVTSDLTLYAGYEIGTYTITFDTNGGTDVDALVGLYQSSISRPENPTRSGYSFGGWYTDDQLTDSFSFNTMPGYDVTLYAKWVPTSGGGIITIPGETLSFLGLAWYWWAIGIGVFGYFGFTKKGRKAIGLK